MIELLSVMRIEHLAAAGVKRWSLPDQIRIPRPGDDEPKEAIVVTPSQFARMTVTG